LFIVLSLNHLWREALALKVIDRMGKFCLCT